MAGTIPVTTASRRRTTLFDRAQEAQTPDRRDGDARMRMTERAAEQRARALAPQRRECAERSTGRHRSRSAAQELCHRRPSILVCHRRHRGQEILDDVARALALSEALPQRRREARQRGRPERANHRDEAHARRRGAVPAARAPRCSPPSRASKHTDSYTDPIGARAQVAVPGAGPPLGWGRSPVLATSPSWAPRSVRDPRRDPFRCADRSRSHDARAWVFLLPLDVACHQHVTRAAGHLSSGAADALESRVNDLSAVTLSATLTSVPCAVLLGRSWRSAFPARGRNAPARAGARLQRLGAFCT